VTTTATTTVATGAATTSAPHEPQPGGRSSRAAAARSEQLYALHHRMVAGLCRALLRDQGEAEDAAQQVFLSAHRSLLNGASPREPAAWLATITRNECWARIRGRMREPLASQDAEDVEGREDPVAEAIRRADLAALWRAIRALPKQQRDALLLREFGGLRYDELAAALAVSEPAVESLLFRARTRLRAQLQGVAAALAPLARLIASSGGPAVAAKAVAVGLGAAAVTGTAVVAPEMLEHRPHAVPPPVPRERIHAVRRTVPIAAAQVPLVVHDVVKHVPVTRTETERHGGRTATTTESERHDGGATTTTTAATGSQSGDGDRHEQTTTLELSGEDGGSGKDGGGSGGSDGGSGGSGGSDGLDGSDTSGG
jgi:RNA polymerase sigma factor (sigma-70 family)